MKKRSLILAFILGAVVAAGAIRFKWAFYQTLGMDRHEWMLRKFSRRLDLNAEQKEKVGAILRSKREKIDGLRQDMEPKFEAVRQTMREEIRKVLRPEQQAKFETLDAEMRERRLKRKKWAGSRK